MRIRVLVTFLVFTLLALSVAQVFAAYSDTLPYPIIFSSGTPALSGDQMSGIIVVAYADYGSSATLSPPLVTDGPVVLRVCGTEGCTNVVATLTDVGPYVGPYAGTNQTRPGMENYLYSFAVPYSPSGSVTITVPTKSLVDNFARHFPAVETQIGTYSTPAMSPPASNPTVPGSPSSAQPAGLYKLAPQLNNPAVSSSYIPLGLLILVMAACGLVLSRKH